MLSFFYFWLLFFLLFCHLRQQEFNYSMPPVRWQHAIICSFAIVSVGNAGWWRKRQRWQDIGYRTDQIPVVVTHGCCSVASCVPSCAVLVKLNATTANCLRNAIKNLHSKCIHASLYSRVCVVVQCKSPTQRLLAKRTTIHASLARTSVDQLEMAHKKCNDTESGICVWFLFFLVFFGELYARLTMFVTRVEGHCRRLTF